MPRRKITALRAARLRLGISQSELAARLDLPCQAVNQQETRGIRSVSTAMRYAEALHTAPDLLIDFTVINRQK